MVEIQRVPANAKMLKGIDGACFIELRTYLFDKPFVICIELITFPTRERRKVPR
jgi:hypothetical protein